MRLLEHQSKRLLSSFGLSFTEAIVVDSPAAAFDAAKKLGGAAVLKAQVPFGGRGKAGALLRLNLRGHAVKSISIEPKVAFTRELYTGVAWDASAKLPVALLSIPGGVDVESSKQVARRTFDPWLSLPA